MKEYLKSSTYIDWDTPEIKALAVHLASGLPTEEDIARRCFEWVRDTIKHSADYCLNPTTCKASEVLRHKTGFCYAKSHLLAALLRANTIPAGLCYQRLRVGDTGPPFCLHGLNAVYLKDYGWYRIDARGNKEGVNARFSPPNEQLAFPIKVQAEADFHEIWPEPLPVIITVLEKYQTYKDVLENLPDIEIVLR